MIDVLLVLVAASLREAVRSPSYRWDNRFRKSGGAILQYTWNGEGCLRRGGSLKTCRQGQALLMLEGDRTKYFYPEGTRGDWEFTWINCSGAQPVVAELIRRHGDVVALDPKGETVGAMNTVARLYETKGFQDRYHSCEMLARLLCALGRELSGLHSDVPVRQAVDYLHDHHRRPINIKEVAAGLAVSREHFSRVFREETGRSPARYLRELRLQTATQLLTGTNMPVAAIAESSGFGSASHFCRAFKATFGRNPQSLRGETAGAVSMPRSPRAARPA